MERTSDERHADAATAVGAPRRRRYGLSLLVWRAVVLVVAGFVLTGPGGAVDLLAPLTVSSGALDAASAELHRWHTVELAGYLTLLTVGSLGIAAWRPDRSVVVVQTVLLSLGGFGLLALTTPEPDQVLVPAAVIAALVIASFPRRRELGRLPELRFRARAAPLAAATATPLLVWVAWLGLDRQLGGTDPHALLGHWASGTALGIALLVAGWVAASSAPGAHALAAVVGLTLLYLGGAAALLSAHDGAWASWGALSSLISGMLFLLSARTRPTGPDTGGLG